MTVLHISAKNLNQERKYNPFKPIEFNNDKVFTTKNTQKEVSLNQARYTNIQKLSKLGISGLSLGAMLIPNVSYAATSKIATVATNHPQQLPQFLQDPSIVIDWSLTAALIGMGIGFGTGVLMLITQGILKMFGQRERAEKWKRNIIDGFIEVMVAVPTISAIYYIGVTLFRYLGVFGNQL